MPDYQPKDVEVRTFAMDAPIEVRAEGEGDEEKKVIEGYAAKFDVETEIWSGHFEKIDRSAFDSILAKNPDTRCLYNHSMNKVLGRTKVSGTLELSVDDTGLKYRCELPNTRDAEDVAALIERGDVSQSSFSFRSGDHQWTERGDDNVLRTILRVDELYDVGPVTIPAYQDTTVAMRSHQEWRSAQGNPNPPNPPNPPAPRSDPAPEAEARIADLESRLTAAQAETETVKTRFKTAREAWAEERKGLLASLQAG